MRGLIDSALAGEAPYEKLTATIAGSYWNLVTPYALSSGLFRPGSREAAGALRYLLIHGGRFLGLVRFDYRPGPGTNAASRLGGLASFHAPCMAVIAPMRTEPRPGAIALLMQSAGLLGGALNSFFQRGIGLHTVVSIGNASVAPSDTVNRVQFQPEGVLTGGVYDAPLVVEDLGRDPRVVQSLC